jgi:hypothetical protein
MSEFRNALGSPIPRSIGRFELLAYLSLVLFFCMFAVLREPSHDPEVPQWQILAPVVLAYLLGKAALIFATARRRQNWARWLYSILLTIDIAIVLLPPYDYVLVSADFIIVLFLATEIAAVYFVFSRESTAWFRPPPPDGSSSRMLADG